MIEKTVEENNDLTSIPIYKGSIIVLILWSSIPLTALIFFPILSLY